MELTQILILAVVQALTEFLPISSSAHLFLASELWGWDYQGVLFDLGLHLGTLTPAPKPLPIGMKTIRPKSPQAAPNVTAPPVSSTS